MSLAVRSRLGPYEIRETLGAGGMGEVYRARDDRLGREVAIKVLAEDVGSDPDRLKRFEKEARAASALSHPNIVTIYEFQKSGATSFIVMECVEGRTLREALMGGPMPLRKVLAIATQIAEGLARAHAAGIVHRDLKPENVMVTKQGLVKIVDFGLAKLQPGPREGAGPLPTATASGFTRPGGVMGTVGYMSPEQASGHPVDFRSDQFSLGAILYEMIAGRRAFKKPTAAQTLAAIIEEEPEPIGNPAVPAALRWLIERCLAKEPGHRYASTEDLARELATWRDRVSEAAGDAAGAKRSRRRFVIGSAAAAIVLAAAAVSVIFVPPPRPPLPRRHAFLVPPDGAEFAAGGPLALSPDGQRIVFRAKDQQGRDLLYLRDLAAQEARPLPGTDRGKNPFWSPDGHSIGFFAGAGRQMKLMRIGITDAAPVELGDTPSARGAAWAPGGDILFGTRDQPIQRVPASGGPPAAVTRLETPDELGHMSPVFLPDGRRFLFLSRRRNGLSLEAASLDAPGHRTVGPAEGGFAYAPPGYLLSTVRETALVARRFDPDRLRISSERTVLADTAGAVNRALGAFTVSSNGLLAYSFKPRVQPNEFVWVDRSGKRIGAFAGGRNYWNVSLSPDGTRLAAVAAREDPFTGAGELIVYDLGKETTTRFPVQDGSAYKGVWSPDGRHVALSAGLGRPIDLYLVSLEGNGPETPLLRTENEKLVDGWSPDGRFLLYEDGKLTPDRALWALPMKGGDRAPFLVGEAGFHVAEASFSPDGRFIAYLSDVSGRAELFVETFPKAAQRWQVSKTGASSPRWARDGRELFYLAPDNRLMSVPIETSPAFTAGAPRPLFPVDPAAIEFIEPCLQGPCTTIQYDVAPDGRRFVFVSADREAARLPVHLVFNWLP